LANLVVTSYALVVPISRGEEARRFVASQGIGRSDLKLGRRDATLLIPIVQPVESMIPDARVEVAEFEAARAPGSYKERANVPAELRSLLPSSFDIVGDLVVIKIPAALAAHEKEIARAILDAHPNLRAVFSDEGVEGELRIRSLRCLAGEDRTRTIHSEYGAKFHVDLAAAYFSPRLANEHMRVAQAIRPGETFVDATAGVGPFTVLAAKRGIASRIVAIDLNPRGLALLRENLALNKATARVEVLDGDARTVIPTLGTFHRVAINLPHSGQEILEVAWRTIVPGGTIHYTVVWPETESEARIRTTVDHLSRLTGRAGRVIESHVVHPYSARDRLYAVDFQVL
jgi:tRNA (guanine37-N1)-methyltransferase